MRTSCARRAVSTAWAAVALALASAGPALAAPPQCTPPPPQTVIEGLQLILSGLQYCSDPERDPLTVAVGPATHGTTGAMGDHFLYTPDSGYTGPDAFTLTASDGTSSSDPVTVSMIVAPNQPPSCPATRSFHVAPDTPATFDPREGCVDDTGHLTPEIVVAPAHGTIGPPGGPLGGYLYTPEAGYEGPDTFTVAVKDHLGAFDQVVVEVTISPNRAPTCVTPVTRHVAVGGQLTLDLRNTCSDPDGDPMSAEPIAFPTHGQVGGMAPIYVYVPDPGYTGTDRIVYRAHDSLGGASNEAVLDLVIGDPPAQQPTQTQTQTQTQASDRTAPSFELTRAGALKLAAIRRSGLKLRLACDEAGTATIELSVAKRVAKRLGIPRVIGRATKTLIAGDNEVVVRLSRRAKRRLASVNRVKLVVLMTGRDNAGNTASDTLELALRR